MNASKIASRIICVAFAALFGANSALASSHMDAPLITYDDAANTTDVYAFVSERAGIKYTPQGIYV